MIILYILLSIISIILQFVINRDNRYKTIFLLAEMHFEENSPVEGQDAGLSFREIVEFAKDVKSEVVGIFLALFFYCLIIPGLVLSSPVACLLTF